MLKMQKLFSALAAIAGLALIVAIGTYEAGATSCSWILWDVNQPTSVKANPDRSVVFNLYTSTYSDFDPSTFDYYLRTVKNTGMSQHIQNQVVTPTTWEVWETASYGPTTCAGTLDVNYDSGTFVVDAWDQPEYVCTGRWSVAVQED